MTAVELFNRVASLMRSAPLPGLSSDHVEGFLTRYRKHLIALIQKQFDERCRLGRLIPDFQKNVGLVNVTEFDLGPTSRTWAAQFGNSTAKLAVKARCHAGNSELKEYAVHLYSDKLGRWLMFPGESWVWSWEEAVQRLVENNFMQMRWPDRDSVDGRWEGARDAAIQLFNEYAILMARMWDYTKPLTEEDRVEIERDRQERWEKHYRAWTAQRQSSVSAVPPVPSSPSLTPEPLSTPTAPSSAGDAVAPSTPVILPKDSGATARPALGENDPGEATPWGGQRGHKLDPADVREGMRVVTPDGLHGTVIKVTELTSIVIGPRVTHERQTRLVFDVRLDSGRMELGQREVFTEAARPTAVVPDVSFDGGRTWLEPLTAWREVKREFDHIAYYTEKAANARKPANKRDYERQATAAREAFLRKFAAFRAWRLKHPHVPMGERLPDRRRRDPNTASSEFTALAYRIMELESEADAPRWPGELRLLKAIPRGYAARFKPGDTVVAYAADTHGRWSHEQHRIERIEDDEAILEDGRRTPLYYLRLDSSASVELPTYYEPQYLVDLGSTMLTDSGSRYPARGAVARAVKEFLSRHGIDVRTHVSAGSMVTSIDLRPGTGRWTASEVERLNALLGNLNARSDGASLEPWQREGAAWDPYADYQGKGPGLIIAPQHIPTFAPILASAMKDAGQSLSRVGEAWLALARRGGFTSSTPDHDQLSEGTDRPRNGATVEQRQAAAEGCREDEFDLPGYGRIRVVCGQAGRRDTWHNLFIRGQRFGYNGGRWAKGQVPPGAVLEALRARGISAFHTR